MLNEKYESKLVKEEHTNNDRDFYSANSFVSKKAINSKGQSALSIIVFIIYPFSSFFWCFFLCLEPLGGSYPTWL